jgi:hypothetical protein
VARFAKDRAILSEQTQTMVESLLEDRADMIAEAVSE